MQQHAEADSNRGAAFSARASGLPTLPDYALGDGGVQQVPAPEKARRPEDPAAQVDRTDTENRQRRRVLVVDDNVEAARLLGHLLSVSGYDVSIVHDGESGIALAKSREFYAIVMDLGMPIAARPIR